MSLTNGSPKLAVVIATKDRPENLRKVLSGIRDQSVHPHQVIVVDGGDETIENVVEGFRGLEVDYVRVYPPALTKQKNAGVANVNADIDLIGFIDDDIGFEDNAIQAMLAFWQAAPKNTGGASFNLTDFNHSWSWIKSLPQRMFFIDNRHMGRVLRSGFNTPIWNVQKDTNVQWLGGGYTVWRKTVFDNWRFDEWFTGSGLWEDVHFSYRVGKTHKLAVVANAKAIHVEGPISSEAHLRIGKTQIVNWLYFVKHNPDLSVLMCLWGCIGRTAVNLSKGIVKLDPGFVMRAWGNTLGLVAGTVGPSRRMGSR